MSESDELHHQVGRTPSDYDTLAKEVDACIEAAGPWAMRAREGGGLENLAMSLALTIVKLRMAAEKNAG